MHRAAEELRRVENEIAEEKAITLARIAGRLQELLEQAAALRAAAVGSPPHERERALAAFESALQQARLYRWYLEVQREAIGLTSHEDLDELYPLPPAAPTSSLPGD